MRSCRSSPSSLSLTSPYPPAMLTCMTGASLIENSKMAGSSASDGISGRARSTFSLTLWSASSMLVEVSNSATTEEYPSTEVDVSSLRPEIVFSSSSILRVTRLSMSEGDTPG